ncbi:hypothetical protein [Microvirga sp. VF16]|uniref:hypothetical protein n=1 Tax=Microvirga sp. VF16 TaxID=2807101 RepID=UPI00193EB2EC|nr:hypothetical protein [Microvirga sp. VF16]QRM32192.1 hypothetical protein JO965_29030 [Microvirga sp. VF16]
MVQQEAFNSGGRQPVTSDVDEFKQEILLTYVQLAVMPDEDDRSKTSILARFGALEIRMTEITQLTNRSPGIPPFWLEVYSHTTGRVIDSCGCFDFDKTEWAIANGVIREARRNAS